MSNKKTHIILLAILAIQIILGVYLYPYFPSMVASHWNAEGVVNGYMSKFWGTFLVSMIMIVFYGLYLVIPRVDPRTENIEKFRRTFNLFWVGMFTFFFYISSLANMWNLGVRFEFSRAIVPAIGLLFYFIGSLMQEMKRNSFMGVRTPWTLASDVVWDKTHKLSGKLFKATGILTLITGLLSGQLAFVTFISCIIISVAASFVYSYKEFKKIAQPENKTNEVSK